MKIAILWGTIFGILQAIISVIAGMTMSSPNALAFSCIGSLLSMALALACGLIAAIQAKAFSTGVWAGLIATAISVLASLILIAVQTALREVGAVTMVVSFAFSIGYNVVLSAADAGLGVFISRRSTSSIPTKG